MRFKSRLILAIILIALAIISVNCVSGSQHLPDETIQVSSDNDTILAGGQVTWVTAQLYYKGEPLRKAGINVTFSCNDSSRASLPRNNYNVTDENGSTKILLRSDDMPGIGRITAVFNDTNGTVSNFTDVSVVRWGYIGGLVIDEYGVNVPNVNVSLWNCHYDAAVRQWVRDDRSTVLQNPQLSNDGRTGYAGQFAFYRVPVGTYILMADREGYNNTTVVTLEQGTATGIVRLPSYLLIGFNASTMGIPASTYNGGEIWGIVCDQNKVSIRDANVSLWYCSYNQTVGQWEKTTIVDVPGNPARSSNGTIRPGEFRFEKLLPGTYYLYADKYGQYGHAIVTLNNNSSVNYIVLIQYYISF